MLTLNINADAQKQDGLIPDITSPATGDFPDFFNLDAVIDIHARCFVPSTNSALPWTEDYVTGDTYAITVGNPNDKPLRGTFTITVASNTISATPFDVTAASLTSQLSVASTAGGKGNVTATMLEPQVWLLDWESNGAVSAVTVDTTYLNPPCTSVVTVNRAGGASSRAQQLVEIKRDKVAGVTLSTAYSTAGADVNVVQYPTDSTNSISEVTWSNAYDGVMTATLTCSGIASVITISPAMTVDELGIAFSRHPSVHYRTPEELDNIAITKGEDSFKIEFIENLSAASLVRTITTNLIAASTLITTSAAHGFAIGQTVVIAENSDMTPINGTQTVASVPTSTTFTIAVTSAAGGTGGTVYSTAQPILAYLSDSDLIYPKGNTGTISFTDTALSDAFAQTTEKELTFEFRVKRTRSSNVKTILSKPVTIKR